MMKIKYVLLFVCLAGCLASCKKDKDNTEEQFKADTTAIRKFITANNITAIKHESGVFYQVINAGSGNIQYTGNTMISASYRGSFLGGNVFEDSKGMPISFQLKGVIAGWQIAIPLIQSGGEIRVIIPSLYAYGAQAQGDIPANSILDFNIKLKDVK